MISDPISQTEGPRVTAVSNKNNAIPFNDFLDLMHLIMLLTLISLLSALMSIVVLPTAGWLKKKIFEPFLLLFSSTN